jgi:peptidoglycan/xylan/chitin deacetylase (PgdA/CDA1 family)
VGNRLLVLGWHNIDPTPAYPDTAGVGRRGFARQIGILSRVANVISLSEAASRMEHGEPLPARAVALTIDDGYQDSLDAAVPILARYRLPATFFLVPGFLSGELGAWWEDLAYAITNASEGRLIWNGLQYDLRVERARACAELPAMLKAMNARDREEAVASIVRQVAPVFGREKALFLDWEGARRIMDSGCDVGSHSMTHAICSREDPDTQARELEKSRSELEARLGKVVDTLAYPNGRTGDYDEITLRYVREIGYRAAVTTNPGIVHRRRSPYEMNRVVVTPTTDVRSLLMGAWRKTWRGFRQRVG